MELTKERPKNHLFPIFVLVIILGTLIDYAFDPWELYSLISSIVGVLGVIFYYKDKPVFARLIFVWICMQIPDFESNDFDFLSAFPLNFGIGVRFGTIGAGILKLDLNILPVALFVLHRYWCKEILVRRTLKINRLKRESFPSAEFPVVGQIWRHYGKHQKADAYIVALEKSIVIGSKSYSGIVLVPKEEGKFRLDPEPQVCGLRLLDFPEMPFNEKLCPFVDWVTVKLDI